MPRKGKSAKCSQPKGWYRGIDADGDLFEKLAPCNEPGCPECGPKIKKKLVTRLDNGFRGRRSRMITVGQKPGSPIPLGKAISKFKALLSKPRLSEKDHRKFMSWFTRGRYRGQKKPRLRKRAPLKGLPWAWVKEPFKKGDLHAHIAVSVFVPKAILDAAWRKATEGWGEWAYVNAGKRGGGQDIKFMGHYMAKYMSKNLGKFKDKIFKRKERRYSFSHHPEFKLPKYKPLDKVEFVLNRDAHKYGLDNLELARIKPDMEKLKARQAEMRNRDDHASEEAKQEQSDNRPAIPSASREARNAREWWNQRQASRRAEALPDPGGRADPPGEQQEGIQGPPGATEGTGSGVPTRPCGTEGSTARPQVQEAKKYRPPWEYVQVRHPGRADPGGR